MMKLINFASINVPMNFSSNCIGSLKDRVALICETIYSFDLSGNLKDHSLEAYRMFHFLFVCLVQ